MSVVRIRRRNRVRLLSRARLRAMALATATLVGCAICAPVAVASPAVIGDKVPPVKMFGYSAGPVQQAGTAAGRPHRVPASATQARPAFGAIKGHPAPAPQLAPPPVGTRTVVRVGAATMPLGHEVPGRQPPASATPVTPTTPSPSAAPTSSASPTPSASPTAPVSTTPPVSATTSPSTSPSTSSSTATTTALLDGGTDNASYSVASTFDTVPMANQSGRIAVT